MRSVLELLFDVIGTQTRMRVPVWEPGCAGFVSGEPACVSDVLAPCGSVGAPQPGGVLGLAGGGVGSVGGAEHGGHAHTDIEGQAKRAPVQQDHGPDVYRCWLGSCGEGCSTVVLRVWARVVSPLVEDGGVGVGGAEGEDGSVACGCGCGGQLGGALVVG